MLSVSKWVFFLASFSFWQPQVFIGLLMYHFNLSSFSCLSSHVSLFSLGIFLAYKRFPPLSRIFLTSVLLHVNELYLPWPHFQISLHSELLWFKTATYLLGRHSSTHNNHYKKKKIWKIWKNKNKCQNTWQKCNKN